jgi:class I lanthipeptide synthase
MQQSRSAAAPAERANVWAPILPRAMKAKAQKAIKEIVGALPDPSLTALTDVSLAGGSAGLAVLCAYLSRAGLDDNENASLFLAQAVKSVSTQPLGPSLYGGFTGIAWAAAHLHEQLFDSEDEDPNEAIDETLIDYLKRSPWEGDYDLVGGLVGIGVYALERLPRPSAARCLELIVDRLVETSERQADGVTWLTRPDLLPQHQLTQCPNGYYNLGLAHGVPGVIALLGQVCAAGVAIEKGRPLLDGAVNWILGQRLTTKTQSTFSPWINLNDLEREDCRLAWCYGDAGIAAALLVAARSVNEFEWEREALAIARRAAMRPPESAGVKDAALCHGAAGLGHVFNRLYQMSGDNDVREAACYWFTRTLELRRKGEGIAGFSAWRIGPDDGEAYWEAEVGVLEGAAGIALALLAASTTVEPAWDRMLLLSARGSSSCESSKPNRAGRP